MNKRHDGGSGLEDANEVFEGSPLNVPGPPPDPSWFEQPIDEPPFARHVLTTPLHLDVAQENRNNSWTEWSGYTVADVYTSVEQEYDALRTRAGLSDISPLVKYRVSGKEAVPYLDRLLTHAVGSQKTDTVARAILCAGNGSVVADALLFRLDDDEFRLTMRSSHMDWLQQSTMGFDVQVEDVSGTIAALSLAGPLAVKTLIAAGMPKPEGLRPHQAVWIDLGGMPIYVSRTGILGVLEFELWSDPADASIVWRRLLDAGHEFGIRPIGATVRNIARIENGVALEGVDYHSALTAFDKEEARAPFDLGLGELVELERPAFNGRHALSKVARAGSTHIVIGLELSLSESVALDGVYIGERCVGTVTSHVWSPSLQRQIALATIEASALGASAGFTVETDGGKYQSAKLAKRPFLTPK